MPQKLQLPDEKQSTDTKAEWYQSCNYWTKTLKQLLQKCLNKQSHLATEVKTENWRYKKNQMEILEQYPKLKYTNNIFLKSLN